MRNAVYTLLRDDTSLQSFGVEKVYSTNAVDTPREKFFLVIRWEVVIPAFKLVGTEGISVWTHLREPNYVLMSQAIDRVKTLMTSTTHREGSDGVFAQAEWTGDTPDVRDDGWGTFTKSAGFRCNRGS